ncbi:MAG: lytic transglycosylase domain-containing protein [Deltaproteobacteria bacterium]|nr:lytic transglycosylase domain-containing protein [Deltaproteobacteria bacterium]
MSSGAPILLVLLAASVARSAFAADIFVGTDQDGVLTITDSPGSLPEFEAMVTFEVPAPALRHKMPKTPDLHAYDALILATAERTGVPAALLKAVCLAESRMNPRAVSPAGAKGLMQLIPTTARALGVRDPFDPAQSLEAGARYLARQLAEFGDVERAVAAYNVGPRYVRERRPWPAETRRFVGRVAEWTRYFTERRPVGSDLEPVD